ncbi:MAG: response regulator transcription factor [Bacteroidetes bacterium]|nr:response regulator transcription factor [Bacteroidota bacterium]MBL6944523.1 response regulator transcription factor [Bacteroidales bacterium]
MIKVSLIDEHPIVCDALTALLSDAEDVTVISSNNTFSEFLEHIENIRPHILITIFYYPDDINVENVRKIALQYPKIRVLVMSNYHDEKQVLKMIKAGAKGHIGYDTNRSEMLEAIYTLRNGYEFYAKTITNILLSSYIADKGINKREKENRQKDLSVREMEIFKLFAEGVSNRSIADKLYISVRTVETHKNNIMKKIGLKTTVDMVKFAIKNNIIQLD